MNKKEATRKYKEYLIIHDTKVIKCHERIAYKKNEYFIFEILFHEKMKSFIAVSFKDGDVVEHDDSESNTVNKVKRWIKNKIKFEKSVDAEIERFIDFMCSENEGEQYEKE